MIKTVVTGLLLSSGLLVGLGANTIAPDAELPVKERLSSRLEQTYSLHSTPKTNNNKSLPGGGPSRRVALVGRSSSKMKPGFFGHLPAPGGSGSTGETSVGGHNVFPYSYLADDAIINFSGKKKSSGSGSGGVVDFSTGQGQSLLGGNSGSLPSVTGTPSYYANSSTKDDGTGNHCGTVIIDDGGDEVPVPEPSTFAFLGSGLSALCYMFYRKQKKAPAA